MIVLAFNRTLSHDTVCRIRNDFARADDDRRIFVVSDCTVISDSPTDHSRIEFDDGSTMVVPKGVTKQAVLAAMQRQIEIDQELQS